VKYTDTGIEHLRWLITEPGDECILWDRGVSGSGYGIVKVGRKTQGAHVAALELYRDETRPTGLDCAHDPHRCTSRLCVNPTHLRWTTHVENEADKLIAGTDTRGEKCGTAKLTEDQVRDIRFLLRAGELPQREISALYGVAQMTVSNINIGRTWGWLT
jgi:hypothetical protein